MSIRRTTFLCLISVIFGMAIMPLTNIIDRKSNASLTTYCLINTYPHEKEMHGYMLPFLFEHAVTIHDTTRMDSIEVFIIK